MIAALERLRRNAELVDTRQEALATLKIAGSPSRFMALAVRLAPAARGCASPGSSSIG